METIRTFIAVPLPEAVITYLGQLIEHLRQAAPEVKWVKPASIHLTLKFLGNLKPDELERVFRGMETLFRQPPSQFEVQTGIIGAFPNFRRPRVLWVGLQGDNLHQLQELQHRVEEAMAEQGFPREDRSFSPHLTLGRIKFLKHQESLQQAIRDWPIKHLPFPVPVVQVMRSELKPGGAVYSVQKEFILRRKLNNQ